MFGTHLVSPFQQMKQNRMMKAIKEMKLLFYLNVMNGAGERLQRLIESLVPNEKIEVYHDVESLRLRLHRPKYDLDAAILVAGSGEELAGIVALRDLLRDLRIILILPNRESDTISMGHKVGPRYISYIDGDFKDVAAVLRKMFNLGD